MSKLEFHKVSLEDLEIQSSLGNLCRFLETSIGPNGGVKIFITSGGYSQFSSSSCTFGKRLDFDNPICNFILQIMKTLPDFGFYFGVFTSSVLIKISKLINSANISSYIANLKNFRDLIESLVILENVTFKRSETSVEKLLPLVQNFLNCKPIVCYSFSNLQQLSFSIVKSVVYSQVEENISGQVFIQIDEGTPYSYAIEGVLYKCSEADESILLALIERTKNAEVKILIFSVEIPDRTDQNLIALLELAIEDGIEVIASQKPIGCYTKFCLRRKQVIVIDRMGEEMTNAIQLLTQSTPVSNIENLKYEDITTSCGQFSSLELKRMGSKLYLLFENSGKGISTLLLHTRMIAVEMDELKISLRKCIRNLQSLMLSPVFVCGGGCFETFLYCLVLHNFNQNSVTPVYQTILESLLRGAGLQSHVKTDLTYHHAWNTFSQSTCNCGLLMKHQVEQCEIMDLPTLLRQDCNCLQESKSDLKGDCVLDLYETKVSVLFKALETCMNILDIGVVVNK